MPSAAATYCIRRDPTLRSEVEALEGRFDTELGPHTRRWAYAQVLANAKLVRSFWAQDVPRLEAVVLPVLAPLARRLVALAAYKVTPESGQRSLERVRGVFRDVDQRSERRATVSGLAGASPLRT